MTLTLARAGFRAVRQCLLRGETDVALAVAAVFCNLPDDREDFLYLGELTLLQLEELMEKYPAHPVVQSLACRLSFRKPKEKTR